MSDDRPASAEETYPRLYDLAVAVAAAAEGGGSIDSARRRIAAALEAAWLAERGPVGAALAEANTLMLEGMALTCDGLEPDADPNAIDTDRLLKELAHVEEALEGGDIEGARGAFATAAGAALRSEAVTPFVPDRLPESVSPRLRGWTSGLGLALQARG